MHFDSISIWFVCERHFRQKHPSGNHLGPPNPHNPILDFANRGTGSNKYQNGFGKVSIQQCIAFSNALLKKLSKRELEKKTRAGWSLNGLYSEKRARLRLNVHYVKTTSNHAAKLYYFLSFWFFHWMVWSIMINKIFCAYFSLGKRENNE